MSSVLIADADQASRTVLANLLAQTPSLDLSGVGIVKAAGAEEAIAAIRRDPPPRVVIVGMTPPGTGALELCKAIRREPAGRALAIAVVGATAPDRQIADMLGDQVAARFFSKPFELTQLVSFVAASLGRDVGGASAVRAPTNLERSENTSGAVGGAAPKFGGGQEGELAERRLPAVLLDIVEDRQTGVLHVTRGKVQKSVVVSLGHPVSVKSNAREETLGQFLRGQGVISAEHHAEAIRGSAATRRRIGEVLIELGALTQTRLLEALAAQVRFKIVRSLRWPDGDWRFEPLRYVAAAAGAPIDVVDLIFRGLRETARLSPLPPHVRGIRGSPLVLSERGRRLRPAWTRVFGDELAEAFTSTATADELIARGFARDAVFGLVDALWLSDGLRAEEVAPVDVGREISEAFSIAELSAQSARRLTTSGPHLHDVLFSDAEVDDAGSQPIAIPVEPASTARPAAPAALLEAYLRIQGANHYDVIGAKVGDSRSEIELAVGRAEAELAASGILGPATAELPLARAVREAYATARVTLLDDAARATYDRGLDPRTREGTAGGIDAEVAYERACEAIRRRAWADAVRELHAAVELAPDEATYRAELGWCHYLKGNQTARAADQARPHLNQALAIDVDHAAAHEYKGVISANLGTDEVEAVFHLQRAIDADPGRANALETFERLLDRRGEHRRLERQYRRMIEQVAGSHLELDLWLRMARLYRNKLDDPASAKIAFEAAAQLAPDDPEIEALITDLESGRGGRFHAESAPLYRRWLDGPHDPEPGKRLLALATGSAMYDHAFLAASCLVAIGAPDKRAGELFRRFRPRFVVRAQRQLDGALWARLADGADSPRIAALLAHLAPAIHQLAPVTLGELEVSANDEVPPERLPPEFVNTRAYVSHMLGVPPPPVFLRDDFEQQVHVGGVNPPVLLVGSEVLSTPERLELAFRLGRAMTYLLPGRALGGSHPAGLLKRFILGAFFASHPEAGEPDAATAPLSVVAAIRALPENSLRRIGSLVDDLQSERPNLDLSAWRVALARTANRIGLLLCGDVPASLRFVEGTAGTEAVTELLRFAISPVFCELRAELGVSIEV